MNRINWTQAAVFGAVVLVVFLLGIAFLPFLFGGWGMMGPGMMAIVLPLGLLILLVLGILWLARGVTGPGGAPRPAPPVAQICPNCGQGVQPDWRLCPYCGESLQPAAER